MGPFPSVNLASVPTVSVAQMREVDRLAIEEFGLDLLQMMENAGRATAELVMEVFRPASVTVLAGKGGNGGGGLAAARHLRNRGLQVAVLLSSLPGELAPATRRQVSILVASGTLILEAPRASDVIVDALLGYSLQGDPHGRSAELIEWLNAQSSAVVALDTPSGLDADTGKVKQLCVSANATLTLALPKRGLVEATETGDLYLGDISIPAKLWEQIGVEVPDLFGRGPIVRLVRG